MEVVAHQTAAVLPYGSSGTHRRQLCYLMEVVALGGAEVEGEDLLKAVQGQHVCQGRDLLQAGLRLQL